MCFYVNLSRFMKVLLFSPVRLVILSSPTQDFNGMSTKRTSRCVLIYSYKQTNKQTNKNWQVIQTENQLGKHLSWCVTKNIRMWIKRVAVTTPVAGKVSIDSECTLNRAICHDFCLNLLDFTAHGITSGSIPLVVRVRHVVPCWQNIASQWSTGTSMICWSVVSYYVDSSLSTSWRLGLWIVELHLQWNRQMYHGIKHPYKKNQSVECHVIVKTNLPS